MKELLKFIYAVISIGLLFQSYVIYAQNNPPVDSALRAYVNKQYLKAAQIYSKAFLASHNRVTVDQRLDAARVWALAGQPDSAFYQLNRIVKAGYYRQLENIFADDTFDNLKNDSRWINLAELLKSHGIRPEASVKKNYILIAELKIIEYDDQYYRIQSIAAEEQYGINSPQVRELNRIELQHDSINQSQVKAILNKKIWPGVNEIGNEGSYAIFIVIQHAPLTMQLKYLPLVKNAVKRKLLNAGNVAILEDRIAVRQHKKQIYGSQVVQDIKNGKYYIQPLKDPKTVNKRRVKVGLQPLKDYLKQWKVEWDVEQYQKDLPEIEKLTSQITYN